MFEVEKYMQSMIDLLQNNFSERLLYVGLQGSYLRNEATEDSDIDVVVIVEDLSAKDLAAYRKIISKLDNPEKACGFICGKKELQNWNPLEICSFLHGTKDYYGELAGYLPAYSEADVVNFIKLSVGNLYHEITHRYLHGDAQENRHGLPYSYKSIFFILQSLYYVKTGIFYQTKKELMNNLSARDKDMMDRAARLMNQGDFDFEEAFSALVEWCQETLNAL